MTNEAASASGIRFDWVLVREVVFVDGSSGTIGKAATDQPVDLQISALLSEDGSSCRVSLGVRIEIPALESEQPTELRVRVEGQFSSVGVTSIPMSEFSRIQAPVILLPFAREAIATVSGKTRIGQLLINPLNLAAVLGGAEQRAEQAGR